MSSREEYPRIMRMSLDNKRIICMMFNRMKEFTIRRIPDLDGEVRGRSDNEGIVTSPGNHVHFDLLKL